MNNYKIIDLETWERKELFEFYNSFDCPLLNATVKVDSENIYKYAKSNNESFFLMCLYAITRAANSVPEFRQRFLDDKVVEFENIAVMTPIMTKYKMFKQIWCEYHNNYLDFKREATPKIAKAKDDIPSFSENYGVDFICASCSPWLHFEAASQAKHRFNQSSTVLCWGKMEEGKIPISVQINHCFIDGYHISEFFENIKVSFSNPELLLIS